MRPIETWNPAVSSLADGTARTTMNTANKTLARYRRIAAIADHAQFLYRMLYLMLKADCGKRPELLIKVLL